MLTQCDYVLLLLSFVASSVFYTNMYFTVMKLLQLDNGKSKIIYKSVIFMR